MQGAKKIWDVKSLLNWSQEYFTSKGINQPKLSSELLLADALNFTRMQIYLNFDHKPQKEEIAKFKEHILKRARHTPIQYILKKAFFRNLELYVDENVLIPRPETELLVDRVLNIMAGMAREKILMPAISQDKELLHLDLNILEIGTGSGAIALSLIKEAKLFIDRALNHPLNNGGFPAMENTSGSPDALPAATIKPLIKLKLTATEKSQDALDVALKNAGNLLTEEEMQNIDFVKADIVPRENPLFESEFKGKTNIVVSNPPYISEENYKSLPEEVRDFEPGCALLAGKTGLEIYKKVLDEVSGLLKPGNSYLVFEIDPLVCSGLHGLVMENIKPANIEIYKDYNHRERIMAIKI